MRIADTDGLVLSVGTRSKQTLAAWIIILTGLIGVTFVGQPAQATAGINNTLNFQGRLLSATGAVVSDGNYNMEFRIYQDGTGTAAYNGGTYASPTGLDWSEDWLVGNSQAVSVKNGYFSVQLGSICPFTTSSCQGESNTAVNWNDNTLWLSIDVAKGTNATASCATTQATFHSACTPDGELLPMRELDSAVYAESAAELDGIGASGFIQNTTSPQSGGANIDYVSAGTGSTGAQIQSAASGTAAVLVLKDNTSSTGDLLQLQPSGSTTPLARFDDNGNLYIAGILDAQTSGGSLSIGPTNATSGIGLHQNTTVATGKTFAVVAASTTATGASAGSGTAVAVKTGADSNKGLVVEANSASQSADLLDLYNQTGGSYVGGVDLSGVIFMNGNITSGTTSAVGKLVVTDGNANGYTATIEAQNQTGTYSLTLPTDGTSGTECLQSTSGSTASATVFTWATCTGPTGANLTLSNLTSPTAINQDLTYQSANHNLNIAQATSGAGNNLSLVGGKGATGSTGGDLMLQGGANGTGSGTPGSVNVKASGGDSTTAFEVQDASGNNVLAINSNAITSTGGGGSLGSWTAGNNLPAANYWSSSTSYNGYVYEMGGENSSFTPVSKVYYHAIGSAGSISGAWSTDTAEPLPGTSGSTDYWIGGCALTYNGYIYYLDGQNSSIADDNSVYYASLNSNGSLNAWTSTTATTEFSDINPGGLDPGMDSSSCIEANGYLYVVSGEDSGANVSVHAEYAKPNSNGTISSWTVASTSLADGVSNATIAVNNNYLYIMGGYTAYNASAENWVEYATINASTGAIGSWTNSANTLPTALQSGYAGIGNNTLYYAGGVYWGSPSYTSTVYKADVTAGSVGSWSTVSGGSMPIAEGWGSYTQYNGYLYTFGGSDSSATIANTYYVQLPSGSTITNGQGTDTIQGALTLQNTSAATLFNVTSSNDEVSIGAGSSATDTTADLLVLDNQASGSSTDPTEVDGAMYYNSALGAFRCGQGGAWVDCANGVPAALMDTNLSPAGATASIVGSHIFVQPLYIPGTMTVNDLYIYISTAASSGAGDVGIYNSSGTLKLDGGSSSLATTSTGLKTIAPTQTGTARVLPPGQYYLAWTASVSSGSVNATAMPAAIYKYNGTLSSGGGLVLPGTITLSSITASATVPIESVSN